MAAHETARKTARIGGLGVAIAGIGLVLSFVMLPWADLGFGGLLFRHPVLFSLLGLGLALAGSVSRGWGWGRERRRLAGLAAGWAILMAEEVGVIYGAAPLLRAVPERLNGLVLWTMILIGIVAFGGALGLIIANWARPRDKWRNEDQDGGRGRSS